MGMGATDSQRKNKSKFDCRIMNSELQMDQSVLFKSLDFVYMPSKDVGADLKYYAEVLGAEVVFNITDMGTQVAQVKLGEGPRLLLAGHLNGRIKSA